MEKCLIPHPLAIGGVCNARDMGGYRVKGGKIRSGTLIRGADLSALTAEGQYLLAQYPVKTVIDLRTKDEIREYPNRRPEGAEIILIDVLKDVLKENSASPKEMVARLGQNNPAQVLHDIYYAFVAEPSCHRAWKRYFEALLSPLQGALYFHCSAGKDRTGFAAALVLLALGAERELIVEDYLLSNRYRADINLKMLAQFQPLAPETPAGDILTLLEVQEAYLDTAFKAMDSLFGGVEGFLTQALGINESQRETLRLLLVE